MLFISTISINVILRKTATTIHYIFLSLTRLQKYWTDVRRQKFRTILTLHLYLIMTTFSIINASLLELINQFILQLKPNLFRKHIVLWIIIWLNELFVRLKWDILKVYKTSTLRSDNIENVAKFLSIFFGKYLFYKLW